MAGAAEAAAPIGQSPRVPPERRGRSAARTDAHVVLRTPPCIPNPIQCSPRRCRPLAPRRRWRGGKGVAVVSWALAIALAVLLAYPAACAAAYAAGAAAAVFRALLWRPHWLADAACAAALGTRPCDV